MPVPLAANPVAYRVQAVSPLTHPSRATKLDISHQLLLLKMAPTITSPTGYCPGGTVACIMPLIGIMHGSCCNTPLALVYCLPLKMHTGGACCSAAAGPDRNLLAKNTKAGIGAGHRHLLEEGPDRELLSKLKRYTAPLGHRHLLGEGPDRELLQQLGRRYSYKGTPPGHHHLLGAAEGVRRMLPRVRHNGK